jgi:osmotically-inducible protein OsmY
MKELASEVRAAARRIDSVLPETLEEAERLATSIERAVQRETGGGVRNLSVEVKGDGVLLRGRCETYYCKQLAQHAAMTLRGACPLTNAIEVS